MELGVGELTKIRGFEKRPDPPSPLPHSIVLLSPSPAGQGIWRSHRKLCFGTELGSPAVHSRATLLTLEKGFVSGQHSILWSLEKAQEAKVFLETRSRRRT